MRGYTVEVFTCAEKKEGILGDNKNFGFDITVKANSKEEATQRAEKFLKSNLSLKIINTRLSR